MCGHHSDHVLQFSEKRWGGGHVARRHHDISVNPNRLVTHSCDIDLMKSMAASKTLTSVGH